MDFLRRAAKTWVAKVLLALLILSFGVWGISGSLLQGQNTTVVTVGDEKVDPNEFLLAYRQQVGTASQRFGRQLTTEEARAIGLEEQVFANLAAGAALAQQASELNLGLSEKRQAEIISQEQIFHDRVTGQFDQATFRLVLRNVGMSESEYLESSAKGVIRSQIAESVSDGFKAPEALMDAFAEYRTEKRDIDFLVLTPAAVSEIPAPQDDALASYFDENIAQYAAPEYRKVAYVRLQAEDIIDLDAVSIESMQEEYEARKASYNTEERRTIDQLTFSDMNEAEIALEMLNAGTSFDTVAEAEGKTATDIAIGNFSKSEVPDQSLAEATFAVMEEGGTSGIINGTFGPVIVRVSKIEPAIIQTFDDVKDQIRNQLALIAAADTLLDVHDAYEDDRAGGMTLTEAATKQELNVVTLDMVDRSGRDENGETIADIPLSQELIRQAFEADINLETPPINIGSDGFVWFEVLDITPARDRTIDEVREKVVADWTARETELALVDKAAELKDRLARGASIFSLADELGIEAQKKIETTRSGADENFGAAALQAAFSGPEGLTTIAQDATGENQILMKVVLVNNDGTGLSVDEAEQARRILEQGTSDALMSQLVTRLQTNYGVTINRQLAAQALAY